MSTLRGFIIAAIVTGLAAVGILMMVPRETPPTPRIDVADPASPAQEQIVRSAPAFDIVRVDPDGTAIIAGRAEPGSDVALMMGDKVLGMVPAGADGTWSMIISTPLPVGDLELHLLATTTEGQSIKSKHVVLISILPSRDRLPLVVLGSPGGASRVLQDPDHKPSDGPLVLETIDYDRTGGVIFAGQAEAGLKVRVLSDGQLVGETRADENGRWVIVSREPLSVGIHQLQVDQIEASGRISAVLALPFERADPGQVANAAVGSVIVQPGNSLWRIARRLYGQGWQYTVIYSANQDQIRNPDLIYPGQVFAVPSKESPDQG